MEAVRQWSWAQHKSHRSVFKGTNPFTEQYGIFSASIPNPHYEETQPNYKLLDALNAYVYVLVAGEARFHCVATSIQ
jgi:nicotinamidase-related amidase